jgi:hypothetical protein
MPHQLVRFAEQTVLKIPMQKIRSIIYASSATRELTTAALEALLTSAQFFNRQHKVTGVLLHSGNHFMQCLEGSPEDVGKAYERVKDSSQHKDIVVYMDGEVAKRSFGSWDMGLAQPAESEFLALSTANWVRATQQPASFDSPSGLEMLKVFWNMRQQAD